MPPRKRKYRHVEDPDLDIEEEIIASGRVRRRKDPNRVAKGKAIWAAKSPAEKQVVLDRLARAREVRYRRTGIRPVAKAERLQRERHLQYSRTRLHEVLLEEGIKKAEAKRILAALRYDTGISNRRRPPKSHRSTQLPQLQNPLFKSFAKHISTLANFLAVPLKSQINVIKHTIPIAQALGVIPPGSSAFSLLRVGLSQ